MVEAITKEQEMAYCQGESLCQTTLAALVRYRLYGVQGREPNSLEGRGTLSKLNPVCDFITCSAVCAHDHVISAAVK